jgi:predicted NBD/HSP70 family sugar kinase
MTLQRPRRASSQLRAKAKVWEGMAPSSRAIFEYVLLSGPLPRAELARRLSLSPATLTKTTRPLLDAGLLVAGSRVVQADTGRPSEPLDVDAAWQHVIGIKLTTDDVWAVRTDLRARVLREYHSQLPHSDPEEVVEHIETAVRELAPEGDVDVLGLSLAGAVCPGDSVVDHAPYLGWTKVPIAELLARRTGCRIALSNDVRALTVAQHWFGAGRHSPCFSVLTVGKGVGCGLVVNNSVVAGHDGRAGLISHHRIREGGPLCQRGHRGCASAYLTSGSIVRALGRVYDEGVEDFDDCLRLARSGEAAAVNVFTEACFALGVLAASVINLIGPDRIILSGEGIGMYEVAPEATSRGLLENLHWDVSPYEIIVEPFAFTEWARGAAAVAIQSLLFPQQDRRLLIAPEGKDQV